MNIIVTTDVRELGEMGFISILFVSDHIVIHIEFCSYTGR